MAHPKGVLIERLQKEGRQPRFETQRSGPDHDPLFEAEVYEDDEVLGAGQGPNKRTAERRAAEEAIAYLDAATTGPAEPDDNDNDEDEDDDTAATPAEAAPGASSDVDDADEGAFEGPWPVFDDVLAAVLQIAHERVDSKQQGDEAREAIGAFALELYKDVLQDLGDVVELDD